MPAEVRQTTLTDEDMEMLLTEDHWTGVIVECWRILEPRWDTMPGRINPSHYAIPEDQWKRLCQHILELDLEQNDPLTSTNHMLDWMNKGPASF